jgi:hypothetical protein
MSRRVDRIISGLGHYFGVIAKDGFVSLLLSDENAFSGGFFTPPDMSTDVEVASLLMDVTEGGMTTPMLLDDIKERVAGSDADTSNLKNVVKICYEPHGDWTGDDSKVLLTPIAADNPPNQGAPGSNGDAYSISKIAGLTADANINKNLGRPGDGDPTMSIIQVLASKYSPANRDTGALSLFLNAMPTLEMSRAVPFLDLVLIQEGEMLNPDGLDDGKGRISKLGLGQFLMGNAVINSAGGYGNDPQEMVVSAKDAAVAILQEQDPDFTTENEEGETQAASYSTAGMEMFTAPQTLVNANENHFEYDPPNNYTPTEADTPPDETPFPDPRRGAAIIDKFRPLMSIKSFQLGVVPSGGMMSYKSGKIKLVLHDRSRLSEVAAFVKPSMLSSTHFLIEYGWAHPDAKVHEASTTADPGILFGEFIGSLRVKEKYGVVNSSFSFDEVGQVEIELVLSMLSSRAANNIQIGMGENSKAEFQKVKELTDMIRSIRGRLGSAATAAIGGDGDILGALSSPSGAMNLDEDTRKAIRNIQRAARRSDNSTLNELGDALGTLTSGGAASSLEKSIQEEIRAKMDVLKSMGESGDPFAMEVDKENNDIRMPSGSTQTYVSFGKLLATFVGVPVCVAGFYDDVQILCYNFNDKASYMRNRNIATFPIPISDLKTELEKALESVMNMTIQGFINFMNTYFLSDQAAPAYGFQGMYKSRDDDDRAQRQLNSQYEEDGAALFAKEQNILKHAYNNEAGSGAETSLEFKMPTLQMYMETVPCQVDSTGSSGGPAKTILRIHIFDSQNTSYSSLKSMLDAVQDKSLGMITPAAIAASREGAPSPEEVADVQTALAKAVDQGLLEIYPPTTSSSSSGAFENGQRYRIKGGLPNIKSFLMNSMPSVRYGQEASGIMKASLQSMSDPALATVNMIRTGEGPEDPVGARKSGLPTRVAPMQLSLDTIGCPLWNFGQQIFIDFGTGTTVDNIYAVVGIDHNMSSGEFTSKVKMVQLDSYGKFESLVDVVNDAMVAIEGIEEEGDTETSS